MIDHIDAENRLIYLDASTVDATISPIDIYREVRDLRATNDILRGYDMFITMKGAEKKNPDGSKRTERYAVLLQGTLIVPYDTSHIITVDGTIISDSGLEGVQCFNRALLSVGTEVDINYVPKQVEVITVNTAGTAPKDIWEYANRSVTVPVAVDSTSVHSALDSYANKQGYQVDITTLVTAVWNAGVRSITDTVGLTTEEHDSLLALNVQISDEHTKTRNTVLVS